MRTLKLSLVALLAVLSLTPAWAGGAGFRPIKRPLKAGAKDPGPGPVVTIANGGTHMSAAQYHDLKGAAVTLLQRFSPESHYFVFLGRDAAPISAFLQNLGGKDLAVNFPASSNESGSDTPQVMKEYVERIIPKEARDGKRKIVIVDATSSGRALDYWIPKLQPHMPGVTLIKAAFSNPAWGVHSNPGDKTVFSTQPFPDVDNYYTGNYENGIAEFPRHAPGAHPVSDIAQSRPEWMQFRTAVMTRMESDTELDKTLTAIGGVQDLSPEGRRQQKATAAAQRAEEAKSVLALRAFPKHMEASSKKLLTELPERSDPHSKGPYLSENGEKLNAWLFESLEVRGKAEKVSPAIKKTGANLVTAFFIEHTLEKAIKADKIRNRDYRRLLGHAIGASKMDKAMLDSLAAVFKKSPDMRRELTEESAFYLEGSKHQPAGTENMSENYKKLMARVAAQ